MICFDYFEDFRIYDFLFLGQRSALTAAFDQTKILSRRCPVLENEASINRTEVFGGDREDAAQHWVSEAGQLPGDTGYRRQPD